jgi:large repetitive protein
MKKLYAVILAFFFISTLSAQKMVYETTSKWFLGFNYGATWHQSDVKNVISNGYGVTLGKSYNFDYGRVFSFDIRGRYLRGTFIGQDSDTSSLLVGTPNSALQPYLAQGFTVHNFQTDIHRGALELVLHLNALTERTGWDPYIFGGAGLTFRQTFGDLYDQNNLSIPYDYQAMLDNGSSLSNQLSTNLDKIYDTPLYGSADRYKVNFMPSWGFGLGYQIGKRISFGLEHKITYTLRDDFDGLQSDVRLENDRHHYTSFYLNFRFRTRWRGDNTNSSGNVNNFDNNCPQPVINISSATGQNVQFPSYRLEATVSNLSNAQELVLTNANGQQFFFNYNPTTRRIDADLSLMEGANNFTLRASNRCGTDTRTFTVMYTPCAITQIQFTNPSNPQTVERNPNFRLTAFVSRVQNANNIRLFHNNNPVFGFTYNRNNGSLSSNLFLTPGLNQFRIEAVNECGTQTMTTSVTFDNCVEPTVQLIAPGATGISVSNSNYTVRAALNNVERADQITFIHNNLATNAFSFANGQLSYNAFLTPGINQFAISVANNCGAKNASFTINLQNCQAPVISTINPVQNASVNTASVPLRLKVEHVTAKQNIQVSVNGIAWNNFNFNTANKELTGTAVLQSGLNTITVQATNNCGTDIETILINSDNCIAPTITIQSPSANVLNASYTFAAAISNMPDASGIQLSWNGQPINFNYDGLNLTSAVNLSSGLNTFVLTANRICGTTTKTLTLTYNDCVAPQVAILQPSAAGSTVNQPIYHFNALVSNITSTTTINLTLNNIPVPFVLNNGAVTADLNLQPGQNNISLNASSACGFDTKTTTVNFVNCVPPTIAWTAPNRPDAIVNQANFSLNALVNGVASNQSISLKHNNQLIPFSFINNTVTANVVLASGINQFTLSALNNCGTAIEVTQVNFDNCVPPVLNLGTAMTLNGTVSQAAYTVSANVLGSVVNASLSLTQNGVSKPFTLNNGTISATLTLLPGANNISLTAVNQCGNDLKSWNVQYVQCQTPSISLVNPSQNGVTVNRPELAFVAFAQHVNQASELSLNLNGQNIPAFDFIGGKISANLSLNTGANTLIIQASTSCGTVTENYNIIYSGCTQPSITFLTPNQSGSTVNSSNYAFSAKVEQVSNLAGISLKLNGNNVMGYTFNNGNVNANLTLQPGANTISLNASNDCGNLTQNTLINFDNCVPPTAQFISPGNNLQVNTAAFIVKANIQNVNNLQGITLKMNGTTLQGATFVNGVLQEAVMLQPGVNNFQLVATNACGSVTQTASVEYLNCMTPVVNILEPTNNAAVVTNATYTFKANVQNINSTQGLSLKLNGILVQNASYTNGLIQANVSLQNGVNTFELSATNQCGNAVKTATVSFDNCQTPSIVFTNPSNNGGSVNRPNFVLQANVLNMLSVQGITLKQNGTPITNFTFVNGQLQANVTLQNGNNSFVLSAQNNCGNVSETITVQFTNCVSPIVAFVQPIGINSISNAAAYTVKFNVQHVTNANGLEFKMNGVPVASANFVNGVVSANVTLVAGKNTFTVKATNDCGSVSQSSEVTYNECLAPVVNILNPATTNSTVTSANFNFSSAVQNMTSLQGLVLKLNGQTVNNLTFTNGQVQATLTLQTGVNNILLSATNACGTDNKTVIVNLDNCTPPTAVFTNPNSNGSSVNRPNFNLQATINHIVNPQGIVLKQNGVVLSNVVFANKQLNVPVSLSPGQNVFDLTVTNNCGTDNEVISVNFNDCSTPVVAFTQPTQLQNNVSQANYVLKANIQNMTVAQGIVLKMNGNVVTNASLQNGVLQANVTLANGLNTFVLTATNACGAVSQTTSINFTPCNVPVVTVASPTGNPTVTSANFVFNGSVQNMPTTNGLSLTLNGNVVGNANFNNGLITANVVLQPGQNTFVLSATNTCGNDSKSANVTFENCTPPTVSFVSPNPTVSITTNNQFTLQALVQNVATNQGISLKHNGNNVNNFTLSNGQLTANLTLVNGINTFVLSATNACGTVTENGAIRLATCNQPVVTITQPSNGAQTVGEANYSLTANIQNVGNPQSVQVTHNGNVVQGFSFSYGVLQANIALQPGQNNVTVTATNTCGNDTKSANITYNSCVAPTVTFVSPGPGVMQATAPNFVIQAAVQNISSAQQAVVKLNGNVVNNVVVNNGQLSANVVLTAGNNQFEITVTNACGTDKKTASLRLSCPQPVIAFVQPNAPNSVVTNANYQLQASVNNVTNPQDIVVRLNGNSVASNFNNGQLTANLTLANGGNTISITANNTCGVNTQTATVDFNNCVAPTITINTTPASGAYTTQSSVNLNATIGNYTPNVNVIVRVNGQNVTAFNNNNGAISGSLNLGFGTTNVEIIANSPCGSNQANYTITRCKPASISWVRPTSNNVTVTEANQVFQFNLFNVDNPQWLNIQLNNAPFTNYQKQGDLVSGMITLNPGINTVRVNINSPCNQLTETLTINYVVSNTGGSNGSGDTQQGTPSGNPRPTVRPGNSGGGGNNPGRTNTQQPEQNKTNNPAPAPTRPAPTPTRPAPTPTKPTNTTKPGTNNPQTNPPSKEQEGDKKPKPTSAPAQNVRPGRPQANPTQQKEEKGGGK